MSQTRLNNILYLIKDEIERGYYGKAFDDGCMLPPTKMVNKLMYNLKYSNFKQSIKDIDFIHNRIN